MTLTSVRRTGRTVAAAAELDFIPLDIEPLLPDFERLVTETIAQVEACPAKPDATFEGYERLLAAIRSATTLEGTLLEKGIALVASANPDLVLVTLERPLPVHETAKAVFRRNDWSKAAGLRLDSEVATREFYKPDLLIVDGVRQLALIIDVKRSVASYKPRTLSDLRSRMMASALVVRDVLERDHDAPPVARADIAILDGASECREEAKGIFALVDLDWMLRIDGAASAISRLRQLYGLSVRALLDARCKVTVAPRLASRRQDRTRGNGGVDDACVDSEVLDTADEPDEDDVEGTDGAVDPLLSAQGENRAGLPGRTRIAVGIASREVH